ncbi:MAG: LamG domain-containing protein [Planctomycetes bacterium]|nr:LamG domain-containing protein [Planctomycetota bacterium]
MNQLLRCVATGLLALPAFAQNTGITMSNLVQGYLDVAYAPELVPQSGITVEAWVTYDDSTIPSGWRFPTLLRQGHTTGGSEDYFLRVEAGNNNTKSLRWKVVTNTGGSVTVNWPFAAGQLRTWTHVAGTYDGSQAVLYVNGVQVAAAAGNGAPIRDLNAESLRIGTGSDVGAPMEVWNGEIDEVRLWPFARTAAEILAAKDLQLDSIPGRVSTWNLDGHALDTSGGQHGTVSGAVAFTANTLSLQALATPYLVPVGTSTAGCLSTPLATVGSAPTVGNAAFAAVATRFAPNAAGFAAIALGGASAPLRLGGIDYWLDPSSTVLVFTTASPLGVMRLGLGLPAWVAPGMLLGFQFAAFDACGPQGIAASQGLLAITR